jgi:hypothetical protein
VREIIIFSLACLLRFVLGTKNYSRTALMYNDRKTLLVLLFECRFRLLVKDRAGVDAFL